MLDRGSTTIASLALAAGLIMAVAGAQAADDPMYPDWEGAWMRIPVKLPTQPSHDQTKPWGRGQEAPLTAEYQAVFEASIADQAAGGLGNFPTTLGRAAGMPHMMMGFGPMEFVVTRNNESIFKERIWRDKADPNLLHDEITTNDHALTLPWVVDKKYVRNPDPLASWPEYYIAEGNGQIMIDKENYFLSGEGLLMPAKKTRRPPICGISSQRRSGKRFAEPARAFGRRLLSDSADCPASRAARKVTKDLCSAGDEA